MLVPMVDVVFADVAQPDQARIVGLNAHLYLKVGGGILVSIKANCIDSTAAPEAVFAREVAKLRDERIKPKEQLTLEPFERGKSWTRWVWRGEKKGKRAKSLSRSLCRGGRVPASPIEGVGSFVVPAQRHGFGWDSLAGEWRLSCIYMLPLFGVVGKGLLFLGTCMWSEVRRLFAC